MTDRATSVTINYTLSLVVVTVLMAGLLVGASNHLDTQRERTIRSEFDVLGNRLAADIGAADALAQRTAGTTDDVMVLRTSLPSETAGASYEIAVNATDLGGHYLVVVRFVSLGTSANREVTLKSRTPVLNSTLSGGSYQIEYVDDDGDGVPDSLEVENG